MNSRGQTSGVPIDPDHERIQCWFSATSPFLAQQLSWPPSHARNCNHPISLQWDTAVVLCTVGDRSVTVQGTNIEGAAEPLIMFIENVILVTMCTASTDAEKNTRAMCKDVMAQEIF